MPSFHFKRRREEKDPSKIACPYFRQGQCFLSTACKNHHAWNKGWGPPPVLSSVNVTAATAAAAAAAIAASASSAATEDGQPMKKTKALRRDFSSRNYCSRGDKCRFSHYDPTATAKSNSVPTTNGAGLKRKAVDENTAPVGAAIPPNVSLYRP